jgi:hypothetical protein
VCWLGAWCAAPAVLLLLCSFDCLPQTIACHALLFAAASAAAGVCCSACPHAIPLLAGGSKALVPLLALVCTRLHT